MRNTETFKADELGPEWEELQGVAMICERAGVTKRQGLATLHFSAGLKPSQVGQKMGMDSGTATAEYQSALEAIKAAFPQLQEQLAALAGKLEDAALSGPRRSVTSAWPKDR